MTFGPFLNVMVTIQYIEFELYGFQFIFTYADKFFIPCEPILSSDHFRWPNDGCIWKFLHDRHVSQELRLQIPGGRFRGVPKGLKKVTKFVVIKMIESDHENSVLEQGAELRASSHLHPPCKQYCFAPLGSLMPISGRRG